MASAVVELAYLTDREIRIAKHPKPLLGTFAGRDPNNVGRSGK